MNSLRLILTLFIVLSSLELKASETSDKNPTEMQQTGTFAGIVRFDGKPPVLPPLVEQGAKVKDAAICSQKEIPNESLVVNPKNRGIAHVFVYLRNPPKGYQKQQNEKLPKVILEQNGCRFVPHAMTLRTQQKLTVKRKDQVAHTFHYYSNRSPQFAVVPGPNGMPPIRFDEPESLPMKVTCDIHPWMNGWILVVDHPFAAVTDRDGKFEIKGLPPGKHDFWFWQERAGWLEKKLTVKIEPGETTQTLRKYDAAKFERE